MLFTSEQNTELKISNLKLEAIFNCYTNVMQVFSPRGKEKHFTPEGDFIWLRMTKKCASV